MARPRKYPRELRERAVRMLVEVRPDYPSEYQAMAAVVTMAAWLRTGMTA